MAFIKNQDTFNSPGEYSDTYVGFRLPFSFGKIDEALHDNTLDSVRDNLQNLLETEPGERLFHPNLGVNFKNLLFEPMDFDEADYQAAVQEQIETQVNRWMPFLAVDKVEVIKQPDRNQYNIKVDFHYKNSNITDSVKVTAAGGY